MMHFHDLQKTRRYILALACLTRYETDHRHNPYGYFTISHGNYEAKLYQIRSKIRYISLVLKESVGGI